MSDVEVEYTNGYHQEQDDSQDEDIADAGEQENSDEEKPRSRNSKLNNNNNDDYQPMAVEKTTRSLSRDENTAPSRTSRHSSTTSESEENHNQSASDRRNKWEKKAGRGFSVDKGRVKAHGGSTAATTLKERFENKAQESKKVVTSQHRINSHHEGGEGEERHSALSLRARFEAKAQENAAPVKRNFVINRTGGGAAKKFGGGGGGTANNKCQVCTKTVYPMEKLEADGHVYHKFCFKCKTCGRTVGLGNYAALQGDIYCKPHLKQLFKLKGNYDEGFGREQRKTDWLKKDGETNGSTAEQTPVVQNEEE